MVIHQRPDIDVLHDFSRVQAVCPKELCNLKASPLPALSLGIELVKALDWLYKKMDFSLIFTCSF